MKILVLITARGGSKRLPGKNIKSFANKPLIAWSIEAGLSIDEKCDVLVSTDDQSIADIALKHGALVPWLRPSELATDTATSVDVAIHALDWYEQKNGNIDALILLQPTTPFRKIASLKKGIELFKQNTKSIVSVSPVSHSPFHCVKIDEQNKIIPFIDAQGKSLRSQDLPDAFAYNGSFYMISPMELRQNRSFISKETEALIMEDWFEGLDIDTPNDWEMANAIYTYFFKGKSCLVQ